MKRSLIFTSLTALSLAGLFLSGSENLHSDTGPSRSGLSAFTEPVTQTAVAASVPDTAHLPFSFQNYFNTDVWHILATDIDRDNEIDLFWGTVTGPNMGMYLSYGTGSGSFSTPVEVLDIGFGVSAAGFVDYDSLVDLVVRNSDWLYVLLNDGARGFISDSVALGGSGVPSIVLGHFNHDAFLDVAVTSVTIGKVYFLNRLGGFYFNRFLPVTVNALDVGDFNRDGIDDLVAITKEDSAVILISNSIGEFTQQAAIDLPPSSYSVSSGGALADFDRDGFIDFAVASQGIDTSTVSVVFGNGAGGIDRVRRHIIRGAVVNLVVTDANRDGKLDIVAANGTIPGRIEFLFGDGAGNFSDPVPVEWDGSNKIWLPLTTADFNRDGNPDFVTGGFLSGPIRIATSLLPPSPVIEDEMRTTGFSNVALDVVNPLGFQVSRNVQTIAGAEHWRWDVDRSGTVDNQTVDYNLMYGEYELFLRPGQNGVLANDNADPYTLARMSVAIGINGSQNAWVFKNYAPADPESDTVFAFHYTVEETASMSPANGVQTKSQRPVFVWDKLVPDTSVVELYHFQLAQYYDLSSPRVNDSTVTIARYTLDTLNAPLGVDSVYYWRFRAFDGASWSEYSRTMAAYIGLECCLGERGNVDGDVDNLTDVRDLVALINSLFITFEPVSCPRAANADGDVDGIIDVRDLVAIINHLYIDFEPLPTCD